MFLTADELAELTGRIRPSAQIRWLLEHHWAYAVRADGRPVVSRREAERQLETVAGERRQKGADEPDFAAARRAG
jgi:hypothetical protein